MSVSCHAQQESVATGPTNTVPTIYIATSGNAPIVDKENYLDAEYYISVPAGSEFKAIGSETAPEYLQIRGRGNASWKVPKKSYKIKLSTKTSLLGMPAHRHFALLACYGAHNEIGLFSYMTGLKIAELTGQPWTPRCRPVELVINNEYLGLYLLTESVKIDKNRVNIYKQPDGCEDPALIPGGWLVEIDNYAEENQLLIPEYLENRTAKMKLTYKSPEALSPSQKEWLTDEFTKINNSLSLQSTFNSNWAKYIDATSMARYFIVREMIHDTDGYNGSFYLHKDKGADSKWVCGPMWDIFPITQKTDWVMNDHPVYSMVHYIPYVTKTAAFRKAFAEEWDLFKSKLDSLYNYVDSFSAFSDADKANGDRWDRSGNCEYKISLIKDYLSSNADWIDANIFPPVREPGPEGNGVKLYGRIAVLDFVAERFSVTNVSGLTVFTGAKAWQFSLAGLAPGIYFLKVEKIDGTNITMKCLIR